MGKGIATAFKSKFGGVQELKNQHKQIGQVAILRRDGRFIYYLVMTTQHRTLTTTARWHHLRLLLTVASSAGSCRLPDHKSQVLEFPDLRGPDEILGGHEVRLWTFSRAA
jgi:hypothetical protein